MTELKTVRRLDECFATCLDAPADAVAKIDAGTLQIWLDYANGQVWKPRRLRAFIRAAKKRLSTAEAVK